MNGKLIATVEVLIALGIYFGYVSPTYYTQVPAIQQQISGVDSAIAAANTFSTKETQLENKKNSLPSSGLAQLSQMLPAKQDSVQFLLNLNALAARSGVSIDKFSIKDSQNASQGPSGKKQPSLYQTIPVTISVKGDYVHFKRFLSSIEHSLRLMDVQDIKVDANNTSSQNKGYSYAVDLQIYTLTATSTTSS